MKRTTKEKLLKTARKLFADNGYEATTTRMIAADANVTLSSISFYYKTKEELCQAVIDYTIELIRKEYSSLSDEISFKLLKGTLTHFEAWDYIDELISRQIAYSLDGHNNSTIKLMCNESTFPESLRGKLSLAVYELIEGPLSKLIQYVSDTKDPFKASVLSRATNGAIFTFQEKPLLAQDVMEKAFQSYDVEKLQTYLHDYLITGLKYSISNPHLINKETR